MTGREPPQDGPLRRRVQLVLTTSGRPQELERFLKSLERQTYRDVHLVVVDQSAGEAVGDLCRGFAPGLELTRVVSPPGASRGRNAGLAATAPLEGGERILGFPDDDCEYPPTLLEDVVALLDASAWEGCTGRAVSPSGAPSTGRWDAEPGPITPRNVWRRGVAFTIFLREGAAAAIGEFDEGIGPGSGTQRGAGEETDYLLRGLAQGMHVEYSPSLLVVHPDKTETIDPATLDKARRYGIGMAYVLRRHRYPRSFVALTCARPLGGTLVALALGRPGRARYHWAMFRGRLAGSVTSAGSPERPR